MSLTPEEKQAARWLGEAAATAAALDALQDLYIEVMPGDQKGIKPEVLEMAFQVLYFAGRIECKAAKPI